MNAVMRAAFARRREEVVFFAHEFRQKPGAAVACVYCGLRADDYVSPTEGGEEECPARVADLAQRVANLFDPEVGRPTASVPKECVVRIRYRNHKGETAVRRIVPYPNRPVEFGSNRWHPTPQWLLYAWDLDKKAERTFALKDIQSWEPEA